MHYLAFFLIRIFRKLIENLGADYNQVRLIVKLKLTMDNRKPLNPSDTKKERNSSLWLQLFVYFFMGIMFSVLIGTNPSVLTSMFISFSFLLMISSLNMIAEFNTLLLDTRDNTIIIPRPVSEKTLLFSRIFHITTYILFICLSFSILPIIVTSVKYNIVAGIFLFLEVILSALFSIFLTHAFYLILMRYTSGERFKDIIAYFQTFISILFMGGYQLLPRYINHMNIDVTSWAMMFAPPTWMAGALTLVSTFQFTAFNVVALLLSLIIPIAGIWIVIKYLAPGYTRKLVQLEQGELKVANKPAVSKTTSLLEYLAKICTSSSSENSSFQVIWKLASRDRTFKQGIFASIGSLAVLVLILVFKDWNWDTLQQSRKYLFLIYMPFYFLFYLILSLKYNDNNQTSWIYLSAPLNKPGEIISGAYKALIVKFYLPLFILINVITVIGSGTWIIPYVAIGFFMNIFIILLIFSLFKSDLPFSIEKKATNSGNNVVFSILMLLGAVALGGTHYFVLDFLKANVWITMVVSITCCWLSFRLVQTKNWSQINPVKM